MPCSPRAAARPPWHSSHRPAPTTPLAPCHHDEIGLLSPAGVRSNGYRVYQQEQLLRLQQILVLRELDMPLDAIAAVLDGQTDHLQALREHHARVTRKRDRLTRVARALARTIEELERQKGTGSMTEINRPENLFEGFDPNQYEAVQSDDRPDQEQVQQRSQQFIDSLSVEDIERMQRETTAAMIRMAEFMASETAVGDPSVQAEIEAAYQLVRTSWDPDARGFKALAGAYDDPANAENFDRIAAGLATYYRDAMVVFADTRLT
ncbi:TipAS antibiotic-recognition domain-containing protein [Nocardia sp. NPDC060249]|uniref:MerR family transcriptional regulator n=1 Tax=Nocardia sp. NPDC060249 TaxID=3347082 RepID=UPI00365DD061